MPETKFAMNQFRTLCIVVALAAAVVAVEEDVELVVVDNSRIEMYSPMCAFERHGSLLADPFDCSQFIQCDYGRAVVKKCSGGLQYDSRLKVCNWDHLVECGTSNPGVSSGGKRFRQNVLIFRSYRSIPTKVQFAASDMTRYISLPTRPTARSITFARMASLIRISVLPASSGIT